MITLQEHCTAKHQAITGKWLPFQKSRSFLPFCQKIIPTHPYSNDNQMNIFLLENFFQERNRCYSTKIEHTRQTSNGQLREREREREQGKEFENFQNRLHHAYTDLYCYLELFCKFFSVFLTHFKSYAHVITCQKRGHSHTAKKMSLYLACDVSTCCLIFW